MRRVVVVVLATPLPPPPPRKIDDVIKLRHYSSRLTPLDWFYTLGLRCSYLTNGGARGKEARGWVRCSFSLHIRSMHQRELRDVRPGTPGQGRPSVRPSIRRSVLFCNPLFAENYTR